MTNTVLGEFPFRGIMIRPYSQELLTPIERTKIFPQTVVFRDLYLTQDKLSISGLFGKEAYSLDEFPHVVEWEGNLYVEDGHHKLVKAACQHRTTASVRIIKL